jgi:alpha-ribazole phosphatase
MNETSAIEGTVIDLIRHGEPEGGSRFRGHGVDDPLSDKGWRQMWRAVGETVHWQHIVSSPLARCREFAQALAERDQVNVSIDGRLKEIGFGSWEGRTRDELKRDDLQAYQAFYHDPVHCRPAGAEALDEFISRVTLAYDNIVQQQRGRHCLIVAHAGVIRAIIAHVLFAQPIGLYKIRVDNAGLARIRYGQYGGVLEFVNLPGL